MVEAAFHESTLSTPIRDLGLTIAGTSLEPILTEFLAEVRGAGIHRVTPRFYLSTEWGVPFDTVAIAIPFYLARPELTAIHAERGDLVEGSSPADILRYLRHEMGHVINYAYRLYDQKEWIEQFGSITQPYREEYRPKPFSRRFVRHLPGWYAQKHPDEDWAETFAVWMTQVEAWREEYADWPEALRKLLYCDDTMVKLANQEPLVTAEDLDEDVTEIRSSLEQFYRSPATGETTFPRALDGALRAIFGDLGRPDAGAPEVGRRPASALILGMERNLTTEVFRWTGHFPERTRPLVRHLVARADAMQLACPESKEAAAAVALTALVTALAMNYIHRGRYLP